ncbi:aspartate racemase [Arthrobacter sp. yr096]|uniref:aspartate/glutamate racemase family protein n=1 Tax=Arthrobacter sp. yr096 TaxID=1761750 RepID=UPI0008C98A08|nr:amino acid racemase [Arthrobacter sp. yr096]SEI92902.1 aspartate racemase [Arthrobacter sp. yr096]
MKTRTGPIASAALPLLSLPAFGRFESAASSVPRCVVGILGGMGPAATADFYLKLVRATPATRDQEHLQVLIWSDPTIPDRTEALLRRGADPTPALIAGAGFLKEAGAGMLAVPCNTAHAFLKAVQAEVDIPIIHMIEETAKYVQQLSPAVQRVGLLSTTGTQKAGLYQSWLDRKGVAVISPDTAGQGAVMDSIRAIKAGKPASAVRPLFTRAAFDLIDAGAQAIIGGCTEVPVGLSGNDLPVPFIDPAEILAAAVVRRVVALVDDAKYSIQYATSSHQHR